MDRTRQAELLNSVSFDDWEKLAKDLTEQSARICADNDCTEDQHNCESYAYISAAGILHGICQPDCWQGWGWFSYDLYGNIAAIPLPWIGNGQDLKSTVDSELNWDFDEKR